MKPRVIAIVGPTSSGKSSLAVWLAKRIKELACGAEIISADSRQVYKRLDIGTGKVTKKEMQGVPHHLLDVVSPKKQFNADDFVRLGQKAITTIYRNGHIPIIVGGTGFYIDALLGRVTFAQVPPNIPLRDSLNSFATADLFRMLQKLDPARAKTIEQHNPRRLVRAIEIATGKPAAKTMAQATSRVQVFAEGFDILWLGLNPAPQKLKKNIHTRLHARLKAGMIAEAKRLHSRGLSYKRMEELGLEYRYLAQLLQKKITRKQFEVDLERAINAYAKRQWRWFKRNKDITWITNPDRTGKTQALKLVQKFLLR